MSLSDARLLDAFGQADPGAVGRFGHREHLRVAWLYLRREPLLGALARFCADLRRFARAAGAPGKYHETLSVAYLLLVHERMAGAAPAADSDAFLAEHGDLLAWPEGPLGQFYAAGTLEQSRAREAFVLPDQTACA